MIGWFALVPAAVAAMAVTMGINDDPAADLFTTGLFVIAAVFFTAGALRLYRPLFASEHVEPECTVVVDEEDIHVLH